MKGKGKEIIYLKTDEIIPYINNPRHNEEAIEKVMASIKEFGFQNPIILDKAHVIITGHTRLQAAKRLYMDKVPCIIAEELTEPQVKAYRIADNKVSEYATWDNDKLKIEFEALEHLGYELEMTGFDLGDIDKLLDEEDIDFEPSSEDEQPRLDQKKSIICPHCGEEFIPE